MLKFSINASLTKGMLYFNDKIAVQSLELRRSLLAADGYLYMGMPKDALLELDAISDREQLHVSVLRTRIRILLHMRKWKAAALLSQQSLEKYPEENEFMVQRAFALHKLRKGSLAAKVLLAAPEWIRSTGILHYNLACYEAQLGNLSTAKMCIRAAIKINSSFKKNARTDPDLQRLWALA
jgi:tetratricopeptide (TPR) repeat protein